ncbi:MAG: TetR/AcrR family transcriptional regulator [Deltaproteobacteria bacterium]|nr:TetR/AcrR family transcriptional regulator [Deltaproteobacteria bacterium]
MRKSKEKVIEVATGLFHRKGYQPTSVDEILERSGVKKSTFYYHFKSKEELALKILDMRIEEFESDVISKTLCETSISPKNRLHKFYERVKAFHQSLKCYEGCPFGNLAIEMSDINEKFRTRLSAFFKRWEEAIESCIREGIENGDFRSDINPTLAAGLILSQLEGAIMMAKTYKTLDPLANGAQTVLKLLQLA